jgi:pimeloyl-ACP methyl ester carboxylesterase
MPTLRTPEGVEIAWYDLGGDGDPVLLAHATGFHAHVWLPVVEHLAAAGFHCFAFDERGHGDSPTPPGRDFSWAGFADDAVAVCAAAGIDRPFGVGHSAGGALTVLAEERNPGFFRSIYAFEPVIMPVDPPPGRNPDNPLALGARRRREIFPTRDAAYDNYASKPPLDVLAPHALRVYVDFGFEDLPDGTVRLKCRGADEADTYAAAGEHDGFVHLNAIRCPTVVACGAETNAPFGPGVIELFAERIPRARTDVLPGVGHFAPLQDPAGFAARLVSAFRAG